MAIQNARDMETLVLNVDDSRNNESENEFQPSQVLKTQRSNLISPDSDYSQGCSSAIKSIEDMERKAFLNSDISKTTSISESTSELEPSCTDKFWFLLPNVLYFIPLLLAYTFRLVSYMIYMQPMVAKPDPDENCLHTEFSFIILSPDRFDPFIFYFLIFGSIFGILIPIMKNIVAEIMTSCTAENGESKKFRMIEILRKSRGFVDGNAKMASLRMLIVYGGICSVLFVTVKVAEQKRMEAVRQIYDACGDDRLVACSSVMEVYLESGVIQPYTPPRPIIQKSCLNYYSGILNLTKIQTCKNCSETDDLVCETCADPNAIPFSLSPICYCKTGYFEKNETCSKNCLTTASMQPKCSACKYVEQDLCATCSDKNSRLNWDSKGCNCFKKFKFDRESQSCVCEKHGTFERNGTCVPKCNKRKKQREKLKPGHFRCSRCDYPQVLY